MSIQQITTNFAGQVGVKPNLIRILCDDSFATITAANYLASAQSQGFVFNNADMALVTYGATPVTQFFTVSISGGNITLEPTAGEVTLPVASGNFAVFTGTSGALDDLGYLPSAAGKTRVVMADAATVANNFTAFADTTGTVKDTGARIIAGTTSAFAGGSTSNVFTVTGLTVSARGTAVIRASTNAVSIAKALPGTDQLTVTFSADPGAGTTVDYIYSTATLS